jgi:hypothetical protein
MAEEARGICVRDVNSAAFITAYAEAQKNTTSSGYDPWSDTVKTGIFKGGDDWYYERHRSPAKSTFAWSWVMLKRNWYGILPPVGLNRALPKSLRWCYPIRSLTRGNEFEKLSTEDDRSTVGQQDLDRIAGTVFRAGEEDERVN